MVAAALTLSAASAVAKVSTETIELSDGTLVSYQLVVPGNYDGAAALPAILAFPGGSQDMEMVDISIQGRWREGAEQRGYMVISPATPDGTLFFLRSDPIFPEFLEAMKERYNIRDGKFHMAGFSNGGVSAFHVAAKHPDYFTSILVMPGFVRGPEDERAGMYEAVSGMCIVIIAGEHDIRWVAAARRDHAILSGMGLKPFIHIVEGEGHVPLSYDGDNASKLYDLIENRVGC